MKTFIKAGRNLLLLGLIACLLMSMTVSAFADGTGTEPQEQSAGPIIVEVGGGTAPSSEATSAGNTAADHSVRQKHCRSWH